MDQRGLRTVACSVGAQTLLAAEPTEIKTLRRLICLHGRHASMTVNHRDVRFELAALHGRIVEQTEHVDADLIGATILRFQHGQTDVSSLRIKLQCLCSQVGRRRAIGTETRRIEGSETE